MRGDDFWKEYEDIFRQQQWYTGTWATGKSMTPKDEIIFGLCYGDLYNRFPELELWNEYNRKHLTQINKDKVVDFLKRVYEYYKLKYKDWVPYRPKKL